MKKRMQHHVFQAYLRAWAVSGKVHCMRDSKIFWRGTEGLAVERDFYKLHELSEEDIRLLKLLAIDNVRPGAKEAHTDFLAMLTFPTEMRRRLRAAGRSNAAIEKAVEEYQQNALEDYHARIETDFALLLQRARDGDLSFYATDTQSIPFFHFWMVQYLRTKGIKERTIEILKEKNGIDVTRIWSIMSMMFAVTTGGSLFVERARRVFYAVDNHTSVPFIAGDQPVINVHGKRPVPTERFSLYYPISPTRALFLGEVDEAPLYSTNTFTEAQATDLNELILKASHSQVFAASRASLERLRGAMAA
jgi:hypothetical protein